MTNPQIERLAGCWELVEATFTLGNGTEVHPFGEAPRGMFILTRAGDFSAHVMNSGRSNFAGDAPTLEEKAAAHDTLVSYGGRISRLDDSALVTRVEYASNPGWVGGEQFRHLEVADDEHLTLQPPPLGQGELTVTGRLRWKRRSGA